MTGEEVGRRSEGGDHWVPSCGGEGDGGVAGGLELCTLELLPLLLVGVLVATEGLRVGEFTAAVLALVLAVTGAGWREAGGFRGAGRGLVVGF